MNEEEKQSASVVVTTRISPGHHALLARMAAADERTVSWLARKLLESAIDSQPVSGNLVETEKPPPPDYRAPLRESPDFGEKWA
jgi:hypothetical protein